MRFLRIIFTLGYLFWGFMLFQAIGGLMLRNAWFEIFKIQKVTPKEIEFIPLDKESTEIKYSFEYNNQIYTGSRKVINTIIEKRLPQNKNEIEISFNTRFPNTNYLDQLGLKTRSGNVGIVISLIFLAFFGLIDLFGNKRKWLKIYGIERKN
jgi:hypothetical protein